MGNSEWQVLIEWGSALQFTLTELQSHSALFNTIWSQMRTRTLDFIIPFYTNTKRVLALICWRLFNSFFHFASLHMKAHVRRIADCNSMIGSECVCNVRREVLKLFQLKVLFGPKTKNKKIIWSIVSTCFGHKSIKKMTTRWPYSFLNIVHHGRCCFFSSLLLYRGVLIVKNKVVVTFPMKQAMSKQHSTELTQNL